MFWGGSRSTKPCVFPCKVAAGDDERYLVYATVAAAVGLSFFFCRSVTVAWSCFGCACVCVVIGCFGISGCRSHWDGCMTLVVCCSGRHETRWKELRCEVWRVQCDVWGKCLLDGALHRGCAQVMFLDNNRPGWRTAHASSFVVVLGSDSWKLRWHMRRDEMRRDELG